MYANRLAHFILFAAFDGIYHERNTDASAYLGVSYRHLTQVLGEFTQYGYLKRMQGGYYITDEHALRGVEGYDTGIEIKLFGIPVYENTTFEK